MKIGIEIRKEFSDIFNDVVQKNGGKPGTVARLIIESQLSFFLSRKVLPIFFNSVNFTLDKVMEQKQPEQSELEKKCEELQELSEALFADMSTIEPDEENEDLIPGIDY